MSKHSALNTFGRSGNPAFSQGFGSYDIPVNERMTLDGAVNKLVSYCHYVLVELIVGWNIPGLMIPAAIIGFILALVTIFRSPAKIGSTAPLYALSQGIFFRWDHNDI